MSIAQSPIAAIPLAGTPVSSAFILRATMAVPVVLFAAPAASTQPLSLPESAIAAAFFDFSGAIKSTSRACLALQGDYLSTVQAATIATNLPKTAALSGVFNFASAGKATAAVPLALLADYLAAVQSATMATNLPKTAALSGVLDFTAANRSTSAAPVPLPVAVMSVAALPLELLLKDIKTALSAAPFDFDLKPVMRPAPTYIATLNGLDITRQIDSCSITQQLDAVHDQVEFASQSPELFRALNVRDSLLLIINTVARPFIVEEITMTGAGGFSVWGRSPSALLDAPFAEVVTIEADGTLTASDLAALLSGSVSTWSAADYPLPDGWSMTGTPMEIITRLAKTVGAVVRPDGYGIRIAPRFAVRPVDWLSATPAATFDRDGKILSLTWKDEPRLGWNSILLSGKGSEYKAPKLELEEDSPQPGDTVHVRVYRQGAADAPFSAMVTDGMVEQIGGTESRRITGEMVSFSQYRGAFQYPASEFLAFTWIGADRGDLYWLAGGRSTELELAPDASPDIDGYGLATVDYITHYERYRLSSHLVPALIMVCAQDSDTAVRVRVNVNGARFPEADAITDELVTTPAAAVAAGTAWLDGNRYSLRNVSLSAPHEAPAEPGAIITLADEVDAVTGAAMVVKRTISISGPSVIDTLEVTQCLS